MEVIEKTKTVETKYTMYKATDGTEFSDRQQCEVYENSAKCVIRTRLDVKESTAWNLSCGDSDSIVEIVDGEFCDIIQYLMVQLQNSYCRDNINDIAKGKKKDKLLIYYNGEGDIYNVMWKKELIEKINKACENSEEK